MWTIFFGIGRNETLRCSFYRPKKPRACIIYAHANAGSRGEAFSIRSWVQSLGCTLFSFDFAGCGESDGDYITLGVHERDDLALVLEWVLKQPEVGECIIYGRSMGSVAGLLVACSSHFPGKRVKGLIVDGPFKSIQSLSLDHAAAAGCFVKCIAKPGLSYMRKRIRKKVHVDIFDSSYQAISQVPRALAPVLFLCARQDEICFPNHQRELVQAYGGSDKTLVEFDGTHNGPRPASVWDAMSDFAYRILSPGTAFKPRSLAGISDGVCCAFLPFVVKDREFVFDHSFPNPMCFRCLVDRCELFDPYDVSTEVQVFLFRDIRYLDSPDDGVLRVALGEDSGFIINCQEALQWLKIVDDALTSMLREQVVENRGAFLEKVTAAAATMMRRDPSMSAIQVAAMIQEVLFGEVMKGLDEETRGMHLFFFLLPPRSKNKRV